MRRGGWLLLVPALGLLPAGPASAWKETGHRVVARVAEAHLSPEARRAVQALLRPGETLRSASTWADDFVARPEGRATACWHVVLLPKGAREYDERRDCPKGCCIVRAIEVQRTRLEDKSQPLGERRRALRFLVHLVADIHQPLHAGRREDGGGGEISVRFFGSTANLHWVWDSGLIERAGLDEETLAERATEAIPPSLSQGGPADWANESHRLALARAYRVGRGGVIGEAYWRENFPVVLRRLGEAGLRLARMLEEALR